MAFNPKIMKKIKFIVDIFLKESFTYFTLFQQLF